MIQWGMIRRIITGKNLFSSVLLLLWPLCGCSPVISREIKKDIKEDITPEIVRLNPEAYVGEKVLWGGIILSSRNEADKTVFEVIQTPLDYLDKPKDPDRSKGRFLVEAAGFYDTAIYSEGRELTIAGEITGMRKEKLGETVYAYPVVRPIEMHLWKIETEPPTPYYPYFYDPFYDPYYPYYPYLWPYPYSPYWNPPYRRHPYWYPPRRP